MQLENMVEDKKTDKKDGQKKDNGHQSIYQRLLDAQNKFKSIGHEHEWKALLEDMGLDEIPVSVTDRQKQLLLLKKAIDVFRTLEPIKKEVKHTRKRTNQKKTTAKAA